jgi:hypothetical protein
MSEIGDLSKLLKQGFINTTYTYDGEDGKFVFKLKTLKPLEEIAAQRDAEKRFEEVSLKDTDVQSIFLAIETLAWAIESVNGTPLELVPGSDPAADTDLRKRRSLLNQFSQKLLLDLWKEYNQLRSKTFLTGTPEEDAALKK